MLTIWYSEVKAAAETLAYGVTGKCTGDIGEGTTSIVLEVEDGPSASVRFTEASFNHQACCSAIAS
ncbi:hypothetical protein O9K51_03765 [Purpureocillium lavendulum]|uniref:Uncharacterized protein n=1 Tax=Purpureocillium lavendulum TaxID=1247861 RepID=A0AB34FX41_9HYPO|nr:hypothetical protein O9K51_03765 [Purpureocillium lavendulum]